MAKGQLNTLDIAIRNGEHVHALIEGVLTQAPELRTLPIVTKTGISYTTMTRTALPSGDFAKVGAGVAPEKSEWKRETGSMSKFEAQMRVPEDVVTIARSEDNSVTQEDVLADEAGAYLRGSTIKIGASTWYGQKISADSFAGLSTLIETATNEVNAGGAANADTSSAYLVYLADDSTNPDGVHYVIGNNGSMQFSDTWWKQQFPDPNDATKLVTGFCNNFLSFMGLVVPRKEAVYRIKNIDDAHPFTDARAAELLRKVPNALKADKSRFRWYLNSSCIYNLQVSRSTVNIATGGNKGVGGGGVFADYPEYCQGIQIVPTDSLVVTERNGLFN